MEDIGKELCERVREVFEQRNSSNAFMVRLKKEITDGRATLRDTSLYSQTLGINLRRAIKEVVTPAELPDSTLYYNIAHSILEPLLRDTYEDVNAICAEVQRKLDDKASIHLAPQKADFPAERVRAACGSASTRDTAEHGIEVLERTSENITAAFSDDYMKANADFRARAGLDTYIERRTDGKCCPWCTGIAGRYQYGAEPHDIYRRHDNCGCTVEYVSARGWQNVWSKKWVSEPKKIEYSKPTVLTKEQARELEKRLTDDRQRGIIKSIDVDDYATVTYGKGISQDVSDVILNTMKKCEKDGGYIISEISTTVIPTSDGIAVLQIEPMANGLLKLNINADYLSGKTLEEINKAFFDTDSNLARTLEEAVWHESGHAISIKGKSISEIKALYIELEKLGQPGISEIALNDGAECLAELEILRHRGENVSRELKEFYKKYMGRDF